MAGNKKIFVDLCIHEQVVSCELRMDAVHRIGILDKSGTCNHCQGDSFAGLSQLPE